MTDNPQVSSVIRDSLESVLTAKDNSVLFGLGVNDPKRVFGTTHNLVEKFGSERVFETPTAENASMGLGVGLAISNVFPIMVHQRLDFFLLSMDQLVNGAAKWRYMFGDSYNTGMLIRLILGRGWGQGPTHSQNLHSWFTHIPNLKVIFPSRGIDFKSLIEKSAEQKYPVILLEDRWIHQSHSKKYELEEINEIEFGQSRLLRKGNDISIITFGFNSILSCKVADFLGSFGISIEVCELVSLKPLDMKGLIETSQRTKRVLIIDSGFYFSSFGSFISHELNERLFNKLLSPIKVISAGDHPEPTSHGVIDQVKISARQIAKEVLCILQIDCKIDLSPLNSKFVDVPDETFKGPF
jgi:pyruvate/2-oxoglutarate/acetoin dehydrogenase E1 component